MLVFPQPNPDGYFLPSLIPCLYKKPPGDEIILPNECYWIGPALGMPVATISTPPVNQIYLFNDIVQIINFFCPKNITELSHVSGAISSFKSRMDVSQRYNSSELSPSDREARLFISRES